MALMIKIGLLSALVRLGMQASRKIRFNVISARCYSGVVMRCGIFLTTLAVLIIVGNDGLNVENVGGAAHGPIRGKPRRSNGLSG